MLSVNGLAFIQSKRIVVTVENIIRSLYSIWYFQRRLYLKGMTKSTKNGLDPIVFSLCFITWIGSELSVDLLKLRHYLGGFLLEDIPMSWHNVIEIVIG